MKYLEKYIFEMIPNIANIPDFPIVINDDTLADFFQLSKVEIQAIENHTKKEYKQFI